MVVSSNILSFQLMTVGKQIPLRVLSFLAIVELAWILIIDYLVGATPWFYKFSREKKKKIYCKICNEEAVGRKKKTYNFINKHVVWAFQSVILAMFLEHTKRDLLVCFVQSHRHHFDGQCMDSSSHLKCHICHYVFSIL